MKKLLLFLSAFYIMANIFAQDTPISIDYNSIKDIVLNDSVTYSNLMERYKRDDVTLSHEDYALIYYGYSFTPAYQGSMDTQKKTLTDLINNQKYEDAYLLGKNILKENPVALYALYNMYYLCQALEKPVEEANTYILKYSKLLHTIALTGDGKDVNTAFKVITVNDEYHLMYNYWGVEDIKGQSLISNCDVFEFKSSKHFKGEKMYFDISRSLNYMQELFK